MSVTRLVLACGLTLLTVWTSARSTVFDHRTESKEVMKLRKLEEMFFQFKIREYPELATLIGEHGYDDQLESFTMEAFHRRKKECDSVLKQVNDIKVDKLSSLERRDAKILKLALESFLEGYQWRNFGNLNSINFLGGIARSPIGMTGARFRDQLDYEKYIKRLKALPVQIRERILLMKLAIALNRTLHRVSMEKVPDLLEYYAHKAMYYAPFQDKPLGIPENIWRTLHDRATKLIGDDIRNAYEELQTFIRAEYLPATRRAVGVHSWDKGIDFYRACLKWHIGADVSPQSIHELGLQEMERIQNEVQQNVMDKVGFKGDLRQFFQHVRAIPQFFNHSAVYLLQKYKDIAHHRIHPKLFHFFKYIYLPPIRIAQLPFDGPWGSYGQNTFYVNLLEPEKRSTLIMIPLTLHEANPGHHFQRSYAKQQDLPNYRLRSSYGELYAVPFAIPSYQAYSEGWALYAEYLGEEMRLFENPYDLFGRYCSEMFRACRMVVDTGIHAFGWSKERAMEFIANYTTFPQNQIEIEVDRYITWPGQSVAYKMGELKIKRLRDRAERELGNKFDIREFHDQILKHGRIPLVILDEVVQEWIEIVSMNNNTNSVNDVLASFGGGTCLYVSASTWLGVVISGANLILKWLR